MTITVDNIRSLTDFRRHTKDYVGMLRDTNLPLVLTVNGEAALVVQNAQAFQDVQNRLQQMEEELRRLKFEALTHDVKAGIEQLESGKYTVYAEDTAAALIDCIKTKGRTQKTAS